MKKFLIGIVVFMAMDCHAQYYAWAGQNFKTKILTLDSLCRVYVNQNDSAGFVFVLKSINVFAAKRKDKELEHLTKYTWLKF